VDNLLLVGIFGILALYFYSSMSVYKSMYKKISVERDYTNNAKSIREKEIIKYENRLKSAVETIKDTEESLSKIRDENQKLKQNIIDLRNRNELLQERVDDLYSSVGMI